MSERKKVIFLSEKLSDYENKYMSSAIAAYEGYIDEIIDPNDTRERLYADILSLIQKNPKLQIKKNMEIYHYNVKINFLLLRINYLRGSFCVINYFYYLYRFQENRVA